MKKFQIGDIIKFKEYLYDSEKQEEKIYIIIDKEQVMLNWISYKCTLMNVQTGKLRQKILSEYLYDSNFVV